jgi:hypothetical protein
MQSDRVVIYVVSNSLTHDLGTADPYDFQTFVGATKDHDDVDLLGTFMGQANPNKHAVIAKTETVHRPGKHGMEMAGFGRRHVQWFDAEDGTPPGVVWRLNTLAPYAQKLLFGMDNLTVKEERQDRQGQPAAFVTIHRVLHPGMSQLFEHTELVAGTMKLGMQCKVLSRSEIDPFLEGDKALFLDHYPMQSWIEFQVQTGAAAELVIDEDAVGEYVRV